MNKTRWSVIAGLVACCCGAYAQEIDPVIPVTAEEAGLTRIVPDTLVWFSVSRNLPQLGGFVGNAADMATPGSSVEATAGVLGDSTFLLAATTQATDNPGNMSFTSVLIPADGAPAKLDNLFYGDSGNPWLTQINLSRQTGNPGRIGGDPRYGAVHYAGAGEVSLFAYPQFNSDGRWDGPFFNALAGVNARSYGVQIHQLDPDTLASTPSSKALDSMFGRLWKNQDLEQASDQIGRTGSRPIGLDNGNFVFVGEDRSKLSNPGGNAAIATILAPDGSIVKEAWKVADGDMWDSAGAYRGGFFIRPAGGIIYFYDNDGNPRGQVDHNATADVVYNTGRSDGTRMASDIRSHYVFMAGRSPDSATSSDIVLSVWDARTLNFVTKTIVNEGEQDQWRALDRCNVACDAYNRVTVVWRLRPDTEFWPLDQCAARVMAFDGTAFAPLTPQFFPFIQNDASMNQQAGFESKEPSVAMTPRAILFYAKGQWNGIPNSTSPAVTLPNTHCYTILSHPDPKPAPQPEMTLAHGSPNSTVSWLADAGLFVLQSSATPTVADSWTDVNPQPVFFRTSYTDENDRHEMSVPMEATATTFYRLVRQW